MIAEAKAAPGKLNVATGATMHLLNAAMFKSMAGLTWVDVPYKGSGPAINDLLSGQMDLLFDQLPSSLVQIKGGSGLKAVAVTSRERTPLAPAFRHRPIRLARFRGDVLVGGVRTGENPTRHRCETQRCDQAGPD